MSLRVIWGICLKKPVIVGPNDSTIEFPTREAIAADLGEDLDFSGLAERCQQGQQRPKLDQFSSTAASECCQTGHFAAVSVQISAGRGPIPPCLWRGRGHKSLHHRLRHSPPQYGCCSAIDPKTNQSMPYTSRVNSLSSTSARAASALFANMTSDCALKAAKSGSTRAPSNRPTESVGS